MRAALQGGGDTEGGLVAAPIGDEVMSKAVQDYASDRVFDGTRRPSDAQIERVRARRRPRLCEECGVYPADPPSKICPGCEAYREHTGQV